jgi:hypothetical protein
MIELQNKGDEVECPSSHDQLISQEARILNETPTPGIYMPDSDIFSKL